MRNVRSQHVLITILLCMFLMITSSCSDNYFTYYTVSFNTQGGSEVEKQRVISGNPVVRPKTPGYDGFDFMGWYKDSFGNEEWQFDTDRVIEDLTLYAIWEESSLPLPDIPDSSIMPEEGTSSLTYELENGTYTVTGVGQETTIVIPAYHNGISVTKIGQNPISFRGAFAGSNIVSIVIPDSIVEISLNAFNNASLLETVTIGENSLLEIIGNNAFSGNSSLLSIYIPSGVKQIGDNAFNNCGSLNSITVDSDNTYYYSENGHLIETETKTLIRGTNNGSIPSGVLTIGNAAFRRSTISEVSIPADVTLINDNAFDNCDNLTSFVVDGNNTTYASFRGILYNKNQTEMIIIPSLLSGNVILSSTLTEIPLMAFDGMSNITSISIPSTVSRIGALAFRGLTATINYSGTEDDWNEITKNSSWQNNANLTIVYEADYQWLSNVLVVYFSATGNTEQVADYITLKLEADSVEIIPEVAYTEEDLDYSNTNSRSQTERRENARPLISDITYGAIDISQYETIIIGYPIWNSYEPMIIRTFIEHYENLSGKTVYTFSTSGSSGGGTAFSSISTLCPNANVIGNCHITRANLSNAQSIVETWIDGLDFNNVDGRKIKLSFLDNEITATLVDNSATRDLVKRLQKEAIVLEFSDFGGSEKIAYPNPKLDTSDVLGCDPIVGDITIYTPWNNLAIFYEDTAGESNSLVKIGTIDNDGIKLLAAQNTSFTVEITLI